MMNSLKSACRFAKSTPLPLYQFQKHRESVFGCKLRIELIIRLIRIFETMEYLNNAVHDHTLTRVQFVHHAHASATEAGAPNGYVVRVWRKY